MRRWGTLILCIACGLLAGGCPKGGDDYKLARKAEALQDYDTALEHYQKALKADPFNADYKLKTTQARFEASQYHVRQGQKLREKGDLQMALAEFQKAQAMDPSSAIAGQEIKTTLEQIAGKEKEAEPGPAPAAQPAEGPLAQEPPQLMAISRAPINLKMANDAKIIYETIAKLAGLTVVFDPDFPARRITTELNNVTLEQALDIVSLQSKSFWKPVTQNIIFIIPDQPQKRRDYEEQLVRTFYLSNTVQPQDLTEIVTGLRQILDLKRIQQLNAQNAIIVRDTPDKLLLAEKLINDIDRAKPEVVIQVEVLQARLDRLRDLGVLPGQSSTLAFTPAGTGTTAATSMALNRLKHLSTADYSVTLPGATATAILTDSSTKIIQNPEIRSVDGQQAKLRIGDRIPVATGSFQAGVGIGAAGGAGIVNPLVNTQFQYIDVGVNVDVTPRVHPNHEVSLKVLVEVSSVTGTSTIGGIQQPIISQRKIEHDIRLKEGEVNILGGLIERVDSKTLNGWPGFAKLPLLHYLFSDEKNDHQENEVLIVLIPRIVRLPLWTQSNLRPLSSGSESNIQVRREASIQAPTMPPAAAPVTPAPVPQAAPPSGGQAARLRFEPTTISLKAGETATLGVAVDNVQDLFSIPMLLQYDPAVLRIEEVRHGGFLSGGTQEIAIVQRVDQEHGQAIISATRQPNTAGVSGSGTLIGVVVRALAPGSSKLAIVQVNARDSQQKALPLLSGEATIQVVP
ncbi:MAG: hypothetical protein LAN84_03765 [Acidobacteriia bacterium]|nr:hypothetical protein [Terriglobia bacterium]